MAAVLQVKRIALNLRIVKKSNDPWRRR